MTDFIHEHPPDAPPAGQAPAPPPDEKTGQKRVYGYIFLLFAVSFALLLWAFLMNQRGTDAVLSELRGSTDALQSTLERNVALEQRVEELEAQVKQLETERDAAAAARDEAQAALAAYEAQAASDSA